MRMTPKQRRAVSVRMKKMWRRKRAERAGGEQTISAVIGVVAPPNGGGEGVSTTVSHIEHQPVVLLAQLDELRVKAHQRVKEIEETLEALQTERQQLLKAFPSFGISTLTGALPPGALIPGMTEEEL